MSSQTKCNGKKEWTKKFIMVVKLDGCYVWHSQCCRVSLLTLFSLLSVSLDSDKKSKRRFFFFFFCQLTPHIYRRCQSAQIVFLLFFFFVFFLFLFCQLATTTTKNFFVRLTTCSMPLMKICIPSMFIERL